ncbi:MAG: DsbC family protein [Thiomicrospira sp.]|uniref:DsbC family protein n=1 Tax=Thiomicrospira sp. TaxID=935 RepID=UPI0019FC08B4|nr:DsbC family protein [Thiomicrospira sp.]MBE0493696.1 DsbC family protein [Thiomicrospira sp.]
MFKIVLKKALPGLVVGALSFNIAMADTTTDKIQQKLNEIIPNAPAAQISASPVEGLYQVIVGPNVIYMTADTEFLFNGNLIKLATRENLTESAKNAARKQTLDAIPTESMIEFPAKGKTKATITVFTDIDCPYCKKFHKDVPKLNAEGITVRYLAFPRSGVDTPSYQKMVSVWCADDRAKTMDQAKQGANPASKNCANPVKDHMMQAQLFGINGTPTIIFEDGNMVPGYVPAEELIPALLQ